MRFLVDENAGPALADWLSEEGHEVFSVYHEARVAGDEDLIRKANEQDWILGTSDKDFGELVYRKQRPHKGVVLLRLDDSRRENRIAVMNRLLSQYGDCLEGSFVVVEETRVRFRKP